MSMQEVKDYFGLTDEQVEYVKGVAKWNIEYETDDAYDCAHNSGNIFGNVKHTDGFLIDMMFWLIEEGVVEMKKIKDEMKQFQQALKDNELIEARELAQNFGWSVEQTKDQLYHWMYHADEQ